MRKIKVVKPKLMDIEEGYLLNVNRTKTKTEEYLEQLRKDAADKSKPWIRKR